MTVINLDDGIGHWFDMEGGGRVQLRTASAETWRDIRKQTVRKRVDFKKVDGTPARLEYEEVNEELQNELFWDHIILGWENLFDSKNQPIPCTREMKTKLMVKSVKFAVFVADSLRILNAEETADTEAREKN